MEKGFVDLKEKPKRLNGPESPQYPHIYLGRSRIKELFKGEKIGEGYQAMIECTIEGDGLEVRKIKLTGSAKMTDKGETTSKKAAPMSTKDEDY